MKTRGVDPGWHPGHDNAESLAAYADLTAEGARGADIDWAASDLDRFAEQTLGVSFTA